MNKSFIWSVIVIVVLVGIGFLVLEYAKPPVSEPPFSDAELGACFIGGCSGEICSDQEGAVSTCEYREEYACYESATCERQEGGECGWTPTQELQLCFNLGVEGK
jgi:hypothetical protein